MLSRRFYLISAICLAAIAALSNGQQFAENSVNEPDADYEEQQAEDPAPVPVRSQVRGQSSSYRSRTNFAAEPGTTRAPPVQILKQINRHNEDGSYTYGFEGSDGSFKIETKLSNGEVKGKYGYVDDSGKVRVVEYGANRYGFQPAGEGITVAPPTLVDETKIAKKKKVPTSSGPSPLSIALGGSIPVNEEVAEYDDGQLEEQQAQLQPQPQPQQQQFASRTSQRVAIQSRTRPIVRPAAPAPAPISRPSANFEFGVGDSSSFQEEQTFGEAPASRSSFSSSQGPVSPRVQVAGAAPVGPAPPRISIPGAAPVPVSSGRAQVRPAPQFLFQQQSSQARQSTRAAARQFPSSGGNNAFDELERLYALPSGGSNPTHDITFSAF